jgi:hypothetical protein
MFSFFNSVTHVFNNKVNIITLATPPSEIAVQAALLEFSLKIKTFSLKTKTAQKYVLYTFLM